MISGDVLDDGVDLRPLSRVDLLADGDVLDDVLQRSGREEGHAALSNHGQKVLRRLGLHALLVNLWQTPTLALTLRKGKKIEDDTVIVATA